MITCKNPLLILCMLGGVGGGVDKSIHLRNCCVVFMGRSNVWVLHTEHICYMMGTCIDFEGLMYRLMHCRLVRYHLYVFKPVQLALALMGS